MGTEAQNKYINFSCYKLKQSIWIEKCKMFERKKKMVLHKSQSVVGRRKRRKIKNGKFLAGGLSKMTKVERAISQLRSLNALTPSSCLFCYFSCPSHNSSPRISTLLNSPTSPLMVPPSLTVSLPPLATNFPWLRFHCFRTCFISLRMKGKFNTSFSLRNITSETNILCLN